MNLIGVVTYQNIESGFWGITDQDGNKWEVIDIPNQLKYPGKNVSVEAEELDVMTTNMWGVPIRVISFSTLNP